MIRFTPLAIFALLSAAPVLAQVSLFDQGRTARLAGDFATAETKLRAAVAAAPQDYLATYNLGLVYAGRAERTGGSAKTANYRAALPWLEKARLLREQQRINEYSIYNSLATVYYALGDSARAEATWKTGLTHAGKLPQQSQAKLFSNVGYFYGVQGKPSQAQKYLAKGAQLGSVTASSNLGKLQSVVAAIPPLPGVATATLQSGGKVARSP